jgi:hypothetical protein
MPKVTAKGVSAKVLPSVSGKAAKVAAIKEKFAEIKQDPVEAIIQEKEPGEPSFILQSSRSIDPAPAPAPTLPEWQDRGGGKFVMDGLYTWDECEPTYDEYDAADQLSFRSLLSYIGCTDRSCRKFNIIGEGGQGKVVLVSITVTEGGKEKTIVCAMKVSNYNYLWLYPESTEKDNQIQLREREANILSLTNGHHIFPDFYAGCVTNDKVITFMQLLVGWMTFSNFLRGRSEGIMTDGTLGKPFPTLNEINKIGTDVPDYRLRRRVVRKILAKLSERLETLWKLGLVHLDLKPGNFMITIWFDPTNPYNFTVDVLLIDPGSVGFIGDPWARGLYPGTPGYSLVKDAREQIKQGLGGVAATMFLKEVSPRGPNDPGIRISKSMNKYAALQVRLSAKKIIPNLSLPTTAAAVAAAAGPDNQFGRSSVGYGGKRKTRKRTTYRKKTHKKKRST